MDFDILIVGGGHAGCEAAWIASQFDLKVGLISMPEVGLASTPCNPAVGGVGKGQVVREIDALGGMMGIVADKSAIQYRILNESKGFAVQSTRVQVDKDLYTVNAEALIATRDNIEVIKKKVDNITRIDSGFEVSSSTWSYRTKKLIITTGTFLNGTLHTGEEQVEGGRVDCERSKGLDGLFSEVSRLEKRFKTGTPARLNKDTINYSVLVEQKSDGRTKNFHCLHDPSKRFIDQVSCYIGHTNKETLDIIRANKERSPIFNGQIKGVGPRYCPSIEDKAFRYPDRHSHHVFVEPEGLTANTIYPNGVSTSLPKEIQLEFLRTIEGFEKVEIEVHGYAVEYDVVDTSKLNLQLEYIDIPGLYFAGQVNGTSGYEEAAGQGIMAGINASLSVQGREPLVLNRNASYIGVMVEDLVSNKRDEPYRLFTARSENRLFVREDNSVNRMYPYRSQLLLNTGVDHYQQEYINQFNILWDMVKEFVYKANPTNQTRFKNFDYGNLQNNIFMSELLKRSQLDPVETLKKELDHFGISFKSEVVAAVAISIKYEGYIQRADFENKKVEKFANKKIDWEKIIESTNVSFECKQRITEVKPETFSQLRMIDGIRPATLAFVAGNLV